MDIIDQVAAAPGPLAAALGPLAELLKIKWSCTKFIGGGGVQKSYTRTDPNRVLVRSNFAVGVLESVNEWVWSSLDDC